VRGSERWVGEGKRLLSFDEEPFPVELPTLALVCLVGAQDLLRVVGVDVLGEGLEELGELPPGGRPNSSTPGHLKIPHP
jgi:hypothetical protein